MLVVVFMAAQLDRVMPEGTQIFRDAMCMFYVSNEGLSITEVSPRYEGRGLKLLDAAGIKCRAASPLA